MVEVFIAQTKESNAGIKRSRRVDSNSSRSL